jgi:hypothetical protein
MRFEDRLTCHHQGMIWTRFIVKCYFIVKGFLLNYMLTELEVD